MTALYVNRPSGGCRTGDKTTGPVLVVRVVLEDAAVFNGLAQLADCDVARQHLVDGVP